MSEVGGVAQAAIAALHAVGEYAGLFVGAEVAGKRQVSILDELIASEPGACHPCAAGVDDDQVAAVFHGHAGVVDPQPVAGVFRFQAHAGAGAASAEMQQWFFIWIADFRKKTHYRKLDLASGRIVVIFRHFHHVALGGGPVGLGVKPAGLGNQAVGGGGFGGILPGAACSSQRQ